MGIVFYILFGIGVTITTMIGIYLYLKEDDPTNKGYGL